MQTTTITRTNIDLVAAAERVQATSHVDTAQSLAIDDMLLRHELHSVREENRRARGRANRIAAGIKLDALSAARALTALKATIAAREALTLAQALTGDTPPAPADAYTLVAEHLSARALLAAATGAPAGITADETLTANAQAQALVEQHLLAAIETAAENTTA